MAEVEIASLVTKFETQGAEQTAAAGDKVADAMGRAEKAMQELSDNQQKLVRSFATTGTSLKDAERALAGNADRVKILAAYTATLAAEQQKTGKSSEDLTSKLDKLRATLDPLAKAQQTYAQRLKEIDELVKAHALNQDEANGLIDRAAKQFSEAEREAGRFAGTTGSVVREWTVLGRELARDDLSRMAGSFTKLIDYMGLLELAIQPETIAFVTLAAAIGAAALAAADFMAEQEKLADLAHGAGASIGLTGQAIEDAATKGAEASRQSISAARDQATEYTKTGKVGSEVMSALIAETVRYANATGQDAKTATSQLAEAFSDPARGVDVLGEKLRGFVDGPTREYIKSLEAAGETQQAQLVMLHNLVPALENVSNRVHGLAGFFGELAAEAQNASDHVAKFETPGGGGMGTVKALGAGAVPAYTPGMAALNRQGAADAMSTFWAGLAQSTRQQSNVFSQDASNLNDKYNLSGLKEYRDLTADLTKSETELSTAEYTHIGNLKELKGTHDALKKAVDDQSKAYSQGSTPAIERDRLVSEAAAREHDLHLTPAQRAAAASAKVIAQAYGQVVDPAKLAADAQNAYNEALVRADNSGVRHGEALAREARALAADGPAALEAAKGYLQSVAAGDALEAKRKAITEAIKQNISVEARATKIHDEESDALSRQIEKWSEAATRAKSTADTQDKYNGLVANGTLTIAQASEAMGIENALREKQEALLKADAAQRPILQAAIDKERTALELANDARREAQTLAANQTSTDELDRLRLEGTLLDANNTQRAMQIAYLKALQDLERRGVSLFDGSGTPNPGALAEVANSVATAATTSQNAAAQRVYNDELNRAVSLMQEMDGLSRSLATSLQNAFGNVGSGLGSVLSALSHYQVTLAEIVKSHKDEQKIVDALPAGRARDARQSELNGDVQRKNMEAEIGLYGDLAGAAASFFGQGSIGYRLLSAIETAYRMAALIHSAQAIASSHVEAASEVADAQRVASAKGAAGIIGGIGTANAVALGATVVGSAIGGAPGGALAGAGSGFMIGNMIVPGIGGIVGGIVGGIAGLLGGSSQAKAQKKQAEEQALQQEQQRLQQAQADHAQLEIRLLTAQGHAEEALNAQRAIELARTDATNQALLAQVYAAEDAQAQAKMQIDLLNAQGKALEATNLQRQQELGQTRDALKPLQQAIYAAQDAAAAQSKLAQAQQTMATVLSTLGDAEGALTLQRKAELSAMDDQQQVMTKAVYAAQDAATAQAKLTQAKQLEATLLGLMSTSSAGLVVQRQNELAAMDASLRPIQEAIYAYQDLATANAAVASARSDLSKAYQTESQALQTTIDKFKAFATALAAFRTQLNVGPNAALSPEAAYQAAQAQFRDVSGKASAGDETALGDLQNVSQAYLDASKAYFASSTGYFRDLAEVKDAVDAAANYSQSQVDVSQQQLDALTAMVKAFGGLDATTLSVKDAITALQQAQATASSAQLAAELSGPAALGAIVAAQDRATAAAQDAYTAQQTANATLLQIAQAATDAATAAAAAAGQAAAASTPSSGGGGGGGPDFAGYVEANSDLQSYYNANASVLAKMGYGSEAAYGQFHYATYGANEGRTLPHFASGADFMVGGASGTDSQLVQFMASPWERVRVGNQGSSDNGRMQATLDAILLSLDSDKRQRGAVGTETIKRLDALVSTGDRTQRKLQQAVS